MGGGIVPREIAMDAAATPATSLVAAAARPAPFADEGGARPPRCAPGALCALRANATLGLTLAAALISFAFGATASAGANRFFALAALMLVAALLAWFARSLDKQISRLSRENEELSGHVSRLDGENRELSGHVDRLDGENRELAGHVQNLQKLHNDSVRMVRQLALYGDECREFGQNLRDISSNLHETDSSLGLTADELESQVAALKAIAGSLHAVSQRASEA